jgi:hypothetical protein
MISIHNGSFQGTVVPLRIGPGPVDAVQDGFLDLPIFKLVEEARQQPLQFGQVFGLEHRLDNHLGKNFS